MHKVLVIVGNENEIVTLKSVVNRLQSISVWSEVLDFSEVLYGSTNDVVSLSSYAEEVHTVELYDRNRDITETWAIERMKQHSTSFSRVNIAVCDRFVSDYDMGVTYIIARITDVFLDLRRSRKECEVLPPVNSRIIIEEI